MADNPPDDITDAEDVAETMRWTAREASIESELDQAEEAPKWEKLGALLAEHRIARGISKREAARLAGFSEGLWRHLEEGKRISYGHAILPNPRDDKLASAARAVGLDPAVAFEIVGRELPTSRLPAGTAALSGVDVTGLPPEDIAKVQGYIDALRERRRSE